MSKDRYNYLQQLSQSHNAARLAEELGFDETLKLAREMILDPNWDHELHGYASELLEALRSFYPDKWNSSWQYDAFLGHAHDIAMHYDERYLGYKRALNKIKGEPPPSLLLALAFCCVAPGIPPISGEEAIDIAKRVIKDKPYIEGVLFIRGQYKSMGDKKNHEKWEEMAKSLEGKEEHLPSIEDYLRLFVI